LKLHLRRSVFWYIMFSVLLLAFIIVLLNSSVSPSLSPPRYGYQVVEKELNDLKRGYRLLNYTKIEFIFKLRDRTIAILPHYVAVYWFTYSDEPPVLDVENYFTSLEYASPNVIGIGLENFTLENAWSGGNNLNPSTIVTRRFFVSAPHRFPFHQKRWVYFPSSGGWYSSYEAFGRSARYIAKQGANFSFGDITLSNFSLVGWILVRFSFEDFYLYFYKGKTITYDIKVRIQVVFYKVRNGTRENPWGLWKPKITFKILKKGKNLDVNVSDSALILSLLAAKQQKLPSLSRVGKTIYVIEVEKG